MLHSPVLSVIVPLYNAGSLFSPFMDSLLGQTLTSLEIIIVDDGSTDGSGERADEYARHAAHIHVIHQPNGGVSRARNAGMALARGQYVTFPDADDTLDPQLYQTLMTMAVADDLDAAQCNALRMPLHSDQGTPLIPLQRLRSTEVLTGTVWLDRALRTHRYLHVVWLGVYRSALIKTCGLQFEPGLHHQDIPWTTEFMLNARRVRYCDQPLYRYTMHDSSISQRPRTGQRNVNYQRHYLKICVMLEQINHRYQQQVIIPRSLHAQITREALRVCHAIRREPDVRARRTMIGDIWRSRTHQRMLRNARGCKQWYQLMLWLGRLLRWHYFPR